MSTVALGSGLNTGEVEAMLHDLGIQEEDLDDVVVEDKEAIATEATRWMAIARVHMDKPYSQYCFYKNMRVAWDLAKEVKICPPNDNLYTLEFACLGDWERVMERGPWTFRGNALMLEPYDGFTKPSSFALNTLEIWIQVHDLPN